MASPNGCENSLPPSKKPPINAAATPEHPDAPSPQLTSTSQGSHPISTHPSLKKAKTDPATEEEHRRRDQELNRLQVIELEPIPAPEDKQPITATEEVPDQPAAADEVATNLNLSRGEYLSPIVSSMISPFPGSPDGGIDRFPAGLSLLPGSVDRNGHVTRNVGSCLGEGGNWVIKHQEWGDRLSCAEYLRRANIKQRDMKIVGWAKKPRPETGTLPMYQFPFIVNNPEDIKRKIAHSESMIGSRGPKRKK